LAPAARTRRRFFEKIAPAFEALTPDYWRKQNFVCDALDSYLPPARKKAKLKVLDVEPVDARYWAYLKPIDRGWYIDEVIVVGGGIMNLDGGTTKSMADAAGGLSARFEILQWRAPTTPFGLKLQSIDIVLLSDGAIKRLGSRLENALKNTRRVLKDQGRVLYVADEEDERALGAPMEKDFSGASPMAKYGFEIVTTKRDCGLAVGYMKKRQATAPVVSRGQASAGGFSKPGGQRPGGQKRKRLY